MTPSEIEDKAEEIFDALGRSFRLRGSSLSARVRKAGRLLPRHLRRDLKYMCDAQELAANPRLAKLVDMKRIERTHRTALRWLADVDPGARARDLLWESAWRIGLVILVVGGGLIAVLAWRGLV
ncbi:hypothetical protein [Thalassobius sp. I31.1]|uniref:hypothetical protein n=1 Tax=Thalassobius sp. I31.1 TaxID=2109912 RepID=UPI000D1A8BBA|nr:hypothetical protein [Thalassobius sp. I31.1]